MNSSAGEARAAKILSNVMDARRKLEEDAEVTAAAAAGLPGAGAAIAAAAAGDAAGNGLRGRLEEAMAVAEVSNGFGEEMWRQAPAAAFIVVLCFFGNPHPIHLFSSVVLAGPGGKCLGSFDIEEDVFRCLLRRLRLCSNCFCA